MSLVSECHVSIGTDPERIGGLYLNEQGGKPSSLVRNGERVRVEVDRRPYDLSAMNVGGWSFDTWIISGRVHVGDLTSPKTTVWFEGLPSQDLIGVLAVAYRKVECSGDALEVIEYWPDGVTWKRRRRCIDGRWVYETQGYAQETRHEGETVKVQDRISVQLMKGRRPKR